MSSKYIATDDCKFALASAISPAIIPDTSGAKLIACSIQPMMSALAKFKADNKTTFTTMTISGTIEMNGGSGEFTNSIISGTSDTTKSSNNMIVREEDGVSVNVVCKSQSGTTGTFKGYIYIKSAGQNKTQSK